MPPGDGRRKQSDEVPASFILQNKARWGRDGGLGGKGNTSRASGGGSLPPDNPSRQQRGFPSPNAKSYICTTFPDAAGFGAAEGRACA